MNSELATWVRPSIQRVNFHDFINKNLKKGRGAGCALVNGRKTLNYLFVYFILSILSMPFSLFFALASYHIAEREEGARFSEQAGVLLLAWETARSVLKWQDLAITDPFMASVQDFEVYKAQVRALLLMWLSCKNLSVLSVFWNLFLSFLHEVWSWVLKPKFLLVVLNGD